MALSALRTHSHHETPVWFSVYISVTLINYMIKMIYFLPNISKRKTIVDFVFKQTI